MFEPIGSKSSMLTSSGSAQHGQSHRPGSGKAGRLRLKMPLRSRTAAL